MMISLTQFDSPLGLIATAERMDKLLCVTFGSIDTLKFEHPELMQLAEVRETKAGVAGKSLCNYLSGKTTALDVQVAWDLVTSDFHRKVLGRLYRLAPGRTVTYDQLGQMVGHERAARAVGGAMRRNPLPVIVPCHRVVPKSGGLGNYTGGVDKKAWLLKREGIVLEGIS